MLSQAMKNPEKGKVVKANFPFVFAFTFAGRVKVSFSYPRWREARWSGKRWVWLVWRTPTREAWGRGVAPTEWKDE